LSAARLFSVGHSSHTFDRLVELLRQAAVTAVADVRSQPFSQRYPQFNRPELARGLKKHEIAYAFVGDQLGGRPSNPALYDDQGRIQYERVRQTRGFQLGLDRLGEALNTFAVAMLCSEEDPIICHRGLMIAPALVERGIRPVHLRASGLLETTEEFEDRLLAETRVAEGILDGLFAATLTGEDRQRLLREAYRVQAGRKAFRLKPQGLASPYLEDDLQEGM
jgi:uncharacterized protein (DUF488 family)